MNNIIQIENITKSFSEKKVVKDVNLIIEKGDIICFCGNNGSGKSTILKLIAGLYYQDSGDIHVFGTSNKSKKINYICEYVMDSGQGYYGYLSAYENARYFLGLNQINFKKVKENFYLLCTKFNFTSNLNKKVDELSQGNRQKLSLIVSLLCDFDVLLLDEPTNGLDKQSIHTLTDILKWLNKEKSITILMTSHDTNFIELLKCKIIEIEEGVIQNNLRETIM